MENRDVAPPTSAGLPNSAPKEIGLWNLIEKARALTKIDINGKAYVAVKDRVALFRSHYGEAASIVTEVLDRAQQNGQRVMVKASIAINNRIVSTGHAETMRGDGQVNSQAAIEACETKAIGRALAALGIIGGEYASADELEGVKTVAPPVITEPTKANQPETDGSWEDVAQMLEIGVGLQNSIDDLNSFYKANAPTIEELKDAYPKGHSDLLSAFTNRKKELINNA